MKVLTRYLLRAHVGPFLFAFLALSAVILINTIAREMAELAGKGLATPVILEFFLYALPSNIALTVPMAMLVAVLYTFSQLAADNELTALRAGGVDLRRAIAPVVVAGLLGALGMVWFNDRVLPESNYRWTQLMLDVGRKTPLFQVREQSVNAIQSADGRTRYLWASEVDLPTSRLWEVAIYDVGDPAQTLSIFADSGTMAFNARQTDLYLTLYDGHVREASLDQPEKFQRIDFDRQVIRYAGIGNELERAAGAGSDGYRGDRAMPISMMRDRIDTLRRDIARERGTVRQIAMGSVRRSLGLPPAVDTAVTLDAYAGGAVAEGTARAALPPGEAARRAANQLRAAEDRIESLRQSVAGYQVEIQKKYAISAAMLIFVLVGAPLAVRFPRGGVGMVIVLSLIIFSLSYLGLKGGETLADRGYVSPVLAMWLMNIILTVVGLLMLVRMGRETSTSRGGGSLGEWLSGRLSFRRRREGAA